MVCCAMGFYIQAFMVSDGYPNDLKPDFCTTGALPIFRKEVMSIYLDFRLLFEEAIKRATPVLKAVALRRYRTV
jgi:hypothetical protein